MTFLRRKYTLYSSVEHIMKYVRLTGSSCGLKVSMTTFYTQGRVFQAPQMALYCFYRSKMSWFIPERKKISALEHV